MVQRIYPCNIAMLGISSISVGERRKLMMFNDSIRDGQFFFLLKNIIGTLNRFPCELFMCMNEFSGNIFTILKTCRK